MLMRSKFVSTTSLFRSSNKLVTVKDLTDFSVAAAVFAAQRCRHNDSDRTGPLDLLRRLARGEVAVHECDSHCAFADGRSAALHRAVANISGCELPWNVGFQIVRFAIERPSVDGFSVAAEVNTGEQVAALVAVDACGSGPFRAGIPTDTNENPVSQVGLRFGCDAIRKGNGAQGCVAVDRRHHRVGKNLDAFIGIDTIDEIGRDGGFETFVPDNQSNLAGDRGEVQRGLRGRIAAAHDEDMLVVTKEGFTGTGPIVNTCAGEFFFVGQSQPSEVNSGRTDGCPRDNLRAVGKITYAFSRREFAANTFASEQKLRAKTNSLLPRALHQIRAADALRKAKIIFDFRAAPSLATNGPAFDHDRSETLRGSVNRRTQTSRSSAINGQIVLDYPDRDTNRVFQ